MAKKSSTSEPKAGKTSWATEQITNSGSVGATPVRTIKSTPKSQPKSKSVPKKRG